MPYKKSLIVSILGCCQLLLAFAYPGAESGKATLTQSEHLYSLDNNLLQSSWSVDNKQLKAVSFINKESGEIFKSKGTLFAIATQKQTLAGESVFLSFRQNEKTIEAVISADGESWTTVASLPRSKFPSTVASLRVGKMSPSGSDDNYPILGDMGKSSFEKVFIRTTKDELLNVTSKPATTHNPVTKNASIAINNEFIEINTPANTTAFNQYSIPSNWKSASVKISKLTDQGLSWGPGLSLQFADGKFIYLNIRAKGEYGIQSSETKEKIIHQKVINSLKFDLTSNDFEISSPIEVIKTANLQMLSCELKHLTSGLTVAWSVELKDGSNYVKQRLSLKTIKPLTIYGLEFINGSVKGAKQIGTVPGSPVASQSLFFGVEMPFGRNHITHNSLKSGFPCQLPMKVGDNYLFSSVVGVYPAGQLRRAFNFYLERERATPSFAMLHYNCWYDFGLNPNKDNFSKVIKDYHQEMSVKRGVNIDSFVMDDGWDNPNKGLWVFNKGKFPNGFDEISKEALKANSHLGLWISPLGGYSGANERTAYAKQMGLIKDQLDLSQPGYKKWFYEKCLSFMKDYGVNYFKWDKAGSGVNPHFMSLIQIGKKLKEHNPKLFINVTVGTWPSPFWLNYIDSTWRTGTGDVYWLGVGDEREQWLTYRDWGCYTKFVQPAPLYPLNAVMHHGLVVGRAYQAQKVTKAGVNLKHSARSFFGTGANLQELYLTPKLMTPEAWDQVAEAAKWARRNHSILVDSHWVGGNPKDLGVYGWISWSKEKSIITLRNSSDKASELKIDLTKALEIPKGFSTKFKVVNAYKDQHYPENVISGEVTFKLKPFEVLCLELMPVDN